MGKLIKALFLIGLGVCIGRYSVDTTESVKVETPIENVAPKEDKQQEKEPITAVEVVDKETVKDETLSLGYVNACKEAVDYIESYPRSKQVTIEHLLNEDFTKEQANYAVDNSDIDWGELALKNAQNTLKYNNRSEKNLKEFLTGEGFTETDIGYALKELGY